MPTPLNPPIQPALNQPTIGQPYENPNAEPTKANTKIQNTLNQGFTRGQPTPTVTNINQASPLAKPFNRQDVLAGQYGSEFIYKTPSGTYYLSQQPNIFYSSDPFKGMANEAALVAEKNQQADFLRAR